MHPQAQAIWGDIWKRTVEKSQSNATNVTLPLFRLAIWGHIWKRTVGKSQTNATNVIMPLLRQAIWGDIWKHTVGKSETNAASVTLPALPQVLWGDIWRGTVQCRKEKREKSTFVIFSRCSERMCPLENLFFREKRYAGQTSTWWLMGKKYSTEQQFGLVCIILILLCSVINHNSLPLLLLHISSNVVLVIISKHWVDVQGHYPFIRANHTEYDQFCTLDVVQKMCRKWGWEQCKTIAKHENWEIQLRNWGGPSGQTGGARVDKLEAQLDLL